MTDPRFIAESGRFNGIAREVHALKSSAFTLGALELGNLCQQLEDMGDSKNVEKLQVVLQELKLHFEQALKELKMIRAERMVVPEKKSA